jgi:hypothetical protein
MMHKLVEAVEAVFQIIKKWRGINLLFGMFLGVGGSFLKFWFDISRGSRRLLLLLLIESPLINRSENTLTRVEDY